MKHVQPDGLVPKAAWTHGPMDRSTKLTRLKLLCPGGLSSICPSMMAEKAKPCFEAGRNEGFHQRGSPKIDGLWGKSLLTWMMTGGSPILWKPPNGLGPMIEGFQCWEWPWLRSLPRDYPAPRSAGRDPLSPPCLRGADQSVLCSLATEFWKGLW